jgi:hypothetical protein
MVQHDAVLCDWRRSGRAVVDVSAQGLALSCPHAGARARDKGAGCFIVTNPPTAGRASA